MAIAAEREGRAPVIRPISVVEGVYDGIYHRLMSLEIAPGARIPIDVLSRDLGVSQTPVREALSRLEREGLVRKEHLVGYSAAPQRTLRLYFQRPTGACQFGDDFKISLQRTRLPRGGF